MFTERKEKPLPIGLFSYNIKDGGRRGKSPSEPQERDTGKE